MMFAIIESDRIARILSGDITKFPGAIKLPDDFQGTVGMYQGEFNDDWTIKPTSERVAGGYLKVPKGYKLDGEQFVELTQAERYQQGVDPIPDGMILDGDDIRSMTRAELVVADKLTQTEADAFDKRDVIDRLASLENEVDELRNKIVSL